MSTYRTLQAAHSPVYYDPEHTMVRLKVTFAELAAFGELDFLAMPTDPEAHGRDICQRAKAGEFGEVAPYVAP